MIRKGMVGLRDSALAEIQWTGQMRERSACIVTHRQMIEGQCPWCDRSIASGQVTAPDSGVAEVRWDWDAIAGSLRAEDQEVRSLTVWNLSALTTWVENVLPLMGLALSDTDPELRANAEAACSRLGRDLSDAQVAWLESQIGAQVHELPARIMLLGKYFGSKTAEVRAKRAAHIYWIIERHPDSDIAGNSDTALFKFEEATAYAPARELWLQQCAAKKSNADVLGNAARFFVLNEPLTAEKLFLQAQTLEPGNPKWHELLAQLYSLSAKRGPEEMRSGKARQALVELEMAEQIRTSHAGIPCGEESRTSELLTRIHKLPNRARAAFDAGELTFARQFANECLAIATSPEIPEFFRGNGNAIHYGHLVLGRVALREGNLEVAKVHLIESGKTTGSPNLGSFGPNMSLAKEVLENGERAAVLEYLELCSVFWKSGSEMLTEWKEQIHQGKIPEFGANLNY